MTQLTLYPSENFSQEFMKGMNANSTQLADVQEATNDNWKLAIDTDLYLRNFFRLSEGYFLRL